MLTLDLTVDLIQVLDKLLFLSFLSEDGRHVFAEGVDYVRVNLREPEERNYVTFVKKT